MYQFQRHGGYLACMPSVVPVRQPWHHHVGVPNGLHLVDVVTADNPVKHPVKFVKEGDNLVEEQLKKAKAYFFPFALIFPDFGCDILCVV